MLGKSGFNQKYIFHDKRTPGLFKVEFVGKQMVALCSKSYVTATETGDFKLSCKEVNKKNLDRLLSVFQNILKNNKSDKSTNIGFRLQEKKIFTYQENQFGLSYLYCKRQVMDDVIHTRTLGVVLTPAFKDGVGGNENCSLKARSHICDLV